MSDPVVPPSPVLLLTNQLTTGGAEMYVVTVSQWLVEHGAEVIVAATPGELVDRLHPDVTYHPVPLQDLRASIPVAAARIRALRRRYRPQVVLANSLVTAIVGRLATWPRRVPVVSVAHGWPADRYGIVSRPLGVAADVVVPVSHDVARRLEKGGLSPDRIQVVANGIDLSPFGRRTREQLQAARQAFGAGPDDVVVASVGRFVEQKQQHRILSLAARLKDDFPELRFGLIGYGPLESDLRRQITKLGLEDVVRLLIRRPDVPDLLMASDLYLSTSDWEGMPLSMIEAMAAGLPIVATDVEGIGALVTDDNGIRCAPGDLDALTEAVRRLARDEVMRLQRGSVSRARAEERFSRDVMCRNLAGVLRRAVDG